VILAALFVMMPGAKDARAESQAGGLPSVSGRVSVLEGIAATLQTVVTTLQTQVTALQTANTGLQNALNAETAARIAADNALQAALNQEATTRKAKDDSLEVALITEGFARINTDVELRGLINNARGQAFSTFKSHAVLVHGASALVGSVGPLPPGSYLIVAKASVSNADHNAVWSCELHRDDGTIIDRSTTGTSSLGLTDDLGPNWSNIAHVVLTRLTSEMKVNMFCETRENDSELFDIAMTATQVGQATIACPDVSGANCP
jgi:hypothetical protein